ncbi:hypothetical protein [Streptomyces sp. KLOTTS4A1]|uniref:hypothetical protein n=1 Tax=Streptomyces sp. KLOTTS4A1 TaxID=3390996 RepID=UPI0039F5DFC6
MSTATDDRPCPSASPTRLPETRPSKTYEVDEEALDEEDRKRRELAESLDPGGTNAPSGPLYGGTPEWGESVATKGHVRAFTPRKSENRSGLVVPIEIINCGSTRAFYHVTVTVTGSNGYRADARMETPVVGVYAGTSWPSELTFQDPEHAVPSDPMIEIEYEREARDG